MLHDTPLRAQHAKYSEDLAQSTAATAGGASRPGAAVGHKVAAEVEYIPYGPADERGEPTCEIVGTFGEVELEYAAIRRAVGLFDSPHRGTIVVTGNPTERRDFFNRMVTQELRDLAPGIAKAAFWLNRKGRIDADLLLIELGDRMLIDVDIHQAAHTLKSLSDFLFAEDIHLADASAQFHHVGVHGRLAAEMIAAASGAGALVLEPGRATTISVDGVDVVIARRDLTGEPGFELIMPYELAPRVWEFLLSVDGISGNGQDKRRARPIGWYAFNIARIEAGQPLMNIDFGPTNLPHETGLLRERVSFTKGCYLGQEIVARMEHLGKPKQMLVGLRVVGEALPVAGTQVFAKDTDGSMGEDVGVVTSSTLSPMLGAAPIAFAMLRSASAELGRTVLVSAEGQHADAIVSLLRFWPAEHS